MNQLKNPVKNFNLYHSSEEITFSELFSFSKSIHTETCGSGFGIHAPYRPNILLPEKEDGSDLQAALACPEVSPTEAFGDLNKSMAFTTAFNPILPMRVAIK